MVVSMGCRLVWCSVHRLVAYPPKVLESLFTHLLISIQPKSRQLAWYSTHSWESVFLVNLFSIAGSPLRVHAAKPFALTRTAVLLHPTKTYRSTD